MKIALYFVACVAACHAAVLVPYRNPDEYGASVQFKNQDVIGNYNFGYNEGHLSGGSFRREMGDAYGNKIGSYGLRDADGRLRIVNYIADANGFRVKVNTNEPGVEPQDPASASINKPALVTAPVIKGPVVRAPIAPFVQTPVIPYVQTSPIIQAPVVPAPVYPAVQFIPPAPVRTIVPAVPQRYIASLNVPAYTNAVVPYAPYKGGYPAPVVGGYYKPAPLYGKVQGPPRAVVGQIAVDPPRYYQQPYAFLNSKSLPTYQPLGFS